MQLHLLTLHYSDGRGGFDDERLHRYLDGKELVSLTEHFFLHGGRPHLLCVITAMPALATGTCSARPMDPPQGQQHRGRRVKVEPDKDLTDFQRRVFDRLRAWRLELARTEGVPPYVIFTNRELVTLVVANPKNRASLGKLPGIGKAKVQRHGEVVLKLLQGPDSEGAGTPTDEDHPGHQEAPSADQLFAPTIT